MIHNVIYNYNQVIISKKKGGDLKSAYYFYIQALAVTFLVDRQGGLFLYLPNVESSK